MKLVIITSVFVCVCFVTVSHNCFANEDSPQNVLIEQNLIEKKVNELSSTWRRENLSEAFSLLIKLSDDSIKKRNYAKSASYLRNASRLQIILGDSPQAVSLLEKSLRFDRLANDIDGEAETLSLLVYFQSLGGNYSASEKNLNELLKKLDSVKNNTAKANIYYFLGEIYFLRENIPFFLHYYNLALNSYRELNDRKGEAKTLLALSYAHLANDELQTGLSLAGQSFIKFNEINDLRGKTLSLVAIGLSNFRIGDFFQALNGFNEAKQLFPEGIDRTEKAILINNIGRVYESIGDCENAIFYFKDALDRFQKENNLAFAIGNLWSLGSVSYQCGQKSDSLHYLEDSLKLSKKLNKQHDIVFTYNELAQIYTNERMYKEAEENYKSALKILRSNDYKMGKARVLSGLGELYLKSGRLQSARENFLSALQINESNKDRYAVSQTLYDLSKMPTLNTYLDENLELLGKSLKITETLYSYALNSNLKREYISNVFDRYELFINLLMKKSQLTSIENYSIQALQAAEKSRASILLENLSLVKADLIKDADPETVKRENEIRASINAKADKLTDLLSQNAEKSETDKISAEINELENELENIKAKLKQQSPIYSAIKNPAPFDVSEFQEKILDENSVLLEFSFGKDESYLWLVEKDAVSAYILPPRDEIESRIEKLRQLLASHVMKENETLEDFQKRTAEADFEYQKEAKILSGQLFGQISAKLYGKRLIVVPDGKLHYFPMSALPLPDSDEPILLSHETVYAPSAQTLLLLEKSREKNIETAKNLLIFSDPVFTKDDPRISSENLSAANTENANTSGDKFRFVESLNSLPRLQASKNESDSILEIVDKSNADSFTGFAATRENLLNLDAKNYKILHFATHGVTDEKRPELSGIVLSRFDDKGQPVDEFFRIHDIYGLNLNADLVVLSACETGIGKEVKGEGLMSLNNAFLQTGAKTVMASLWKVEDTATLELMKNFYGGIVNENLTPSQSLRQAQIKLRQNNQYRSPFYWAAFTVQGDFRNVPKISHGFNKYYYAAALIPLTMLGFYLYRRRKKIRRFSLKRFFRKARPKD